MALYFHDNRTQLVLAEKEAKFLLRLEMVRKSASISDRTI